MARRLPPNNQTQGWHVPGHHAHLHLGVLQPSGPRTGVFHSAAFLLTPQAPCFLTSPVLWGHR